MFIVKNEKMILVINSCLRLSQNNEGYVFFIVSTSDSKEDQRNKDKRKKSSEKSSLYGDGDLPKVPTRVLIEVERRPDDITPAQRWFTARFFGTPRFLNALCHLPSITAYGKLCPNFTFTELAVGDSWETALAQ